AQFQQRHGDFHGARTEGYEGQENRGRGDVEQNRAPDPAEPRPRLWKCQAEMQEQRGCQQARHQVPEINHLIEVVELAGVVKAQRDEARQTQNIKVPGFVRAAPPEVDEQPDDEVCGPHRVLIQDRPVQRLLCTRYFARLHAPIRTSTLATSVACSILTPPISSRRSPWWIPAFRPGLPGFTYSASTLACRSTQITPSSGSRKCCCSKRSE